MRIRGWTAAVAAAGLLGTAPCAALGAGEEGRPGTGAAAKGPPWISVEYPPNGIDTATRGAVVLVRTYHHEHRVGLPLEGTAHGLVDGRRVRRPVEIAGTASPGAWAVRADLPREGTWVLALTARDGAGEGRASVLVALAPGNEEVSLIRVPRMREGNWPRTLRTGDVEAMLRSAEAVGEALAAADPGFRAVGIRLGAIGLGLLLLPAGLTLGRRRIRV